MYKTSFAIFLLLFTHTLSAQLMQTIDSNYVLKINPSIAPAHKRVLIDKFHKTIFTRPGPEHACQVMFNLAKQDGFQIAYTDKKLDGQQLDSSDILIIAGLLNDRIVVNQESGKETIFWKSPLSDSEVDKITKWVANGGRLLLFLSHYPNGSGGKPLLEALGVRFRDGGVSHPDYPGINGDPCAWFTMDSTNGLINQKHPVLSNRNRNNLNVESVRFLCATAIFRNPEDVILSFPKGSTHQAPFDNEEDVLKENSDNYAGLLGFKYGRGKVIVSSDLGVFRNNVIRDKEKVYYNTITDPQADNAKLFVKCMRWLGE